MQKDKHNKGYVNNCNELDISNVPDQLKEDLTNISKNLGVTRSAFLKGKLIEIRNSYPEDMRKKRVD